GKLAKPGNASPRAGSCRPASTRAIVRLRSRNAAHARLRRTLVSGNKLIIRLPAADSEVNGHPPVAADYSGRLGDFHLVKEIGRGGMGIVYEAEQISLRRRVAVKVLPFAGTLDPKQLQRFKNEAQAAAQLHHASI